MPTRNPAVRARVQAAYVARQRERGHVQIQWWVNRAERDLLETTLKRHRLGAAPAEPEAPPADPRQVDLEEATEGASVPELSEADLKRGEAVLDGRVGVEAVHAEWRRHVAGMDEPLRRPVGHWIWFCNKRAAESG